MSRLSPGPAALTLAMTLLGGGVVAGDAPLTLNDQEYFEQPGLSVFVFSNEYNGMFFDEKTAGVELIHHGVRTSTGGSVRVKPTPEQWDQIPKVVERKADRENGQIEVHLRFEELDFDSRLVVKPEGDGFVMSVVLDEPLPAPLEGRTGLNLEFLPSAYFGKTYLMDGQPALLPQYPSGPMQVREAETQIIQFAGHTTFDDRGRGEYVETEPLAAGRTLVLAPGDPERRVTIETRRGDLMLLDGRNVAQNNWYVVRTLIPSGKTGTVAEWLVRPHTVEDWTRTPVVGFSQAGYHPDQQKIAVVELDPKDIPLPTLSVFEVTAAGDTVEKLTVDVKPWGEWQRHRYARADFSAIEKPGLYFLQYGDQRTETFPVDPGVYDEIWHPTLDVWFPVQMDHLFVNEAYRVWHGAAHLDDARQAPVSNQHFDGYQMGPSTESPYEPGEHIPGLNVGGWFDAGDYDIRTGSHALTVLHLVETWELFRPERDQTLVDREQRYVDIHHPDGIADLLQQIEQGALALVAQHRAFGRAIMGIIVPELHQYHHLGDGVTQTDGLIYDPALEPGQVEGDRSGTPDDRWAFTGRSAAMNYSSSAALAAASRALKGHDDALAEECLAAARKAFDDESQAPPAESSNPWEAMFRGAAERQAALQLLIATEDQRYATRFDELIWPALNRAVGWSLSSAIRAVPHMDEEYRKKLESHVVRYKEEADTLLEQNPYGVPMRPGGWAGNGGIISWAMTNYLVHEAYPEIMGPEYALRGLVYILGRHPYSNTSFVSGVGARSKLVAYGSNRADYSFIAGGVVPGVLLLKPDFPENKDDWPFLWGENEYVIDICAEYILLAHAVSDLLAE